MKLKKIAIAFCLFSFLSTITQAQSEEKIEINVYNIKVHEQVSRIKLHAKVREVCRETANAFFTNNTDIKSATIALMPSVKDVDGVAFETLSDILATKGKEEGFKVIPGDEVRKLLVIQTVSEKKLEDIVDQSTVTKLGDQLGCDIVIIPALDVVDEWKSAEPKISVGLKFAPWDISKGTRLAAQGGDPYIGIITPELPFYERNLMTILYSLGGLVVAFFLYRIGKHTIKAI